MFINKHIILLIALLICTPAVAHYNDAAPSNQYRTPHCSPNVRDLPIFQMRADKGKDSGRVTMSTTVLIAKNTWATSAHGIAFGKSARITIFLPGAREVEAKITWFDKGKDIAILEANSYKIKPIDSMSYDIGDHEQVWTIGYPGISDGLLMSFTGMFVRYSSNYQIVATSIGMKGMSGGALVRCVDGRAELFGIITNLVKTVVEMKIWTDGDGVLHSDRTVTNSGVSLSTPISVKDK